VFGVFVAPIHSSEPSRPVVPQMVFDGLFALQHRGQESAGMAVSDGETITVLKDMGLVTSVFDERSISSLHGHLALGHVRYSTSGPSTWHNAQPAYRSVGSAGFALGHNGNLTNTEKLAADLGMLPGILTSDSDIVAELLARCFPPDSDESRDDDRDLETALVEVLPRLEGAFSLGVLDAKHLIAVRDPNGFRPLCLGVLDQDPWSAEEASDAAAAPPGRGPAGWVIASETPALDVVGARFVRELEAGEMLVIDENGPRSVWPFPPARVDPRLCIFEFVYFARPDSRLRGREVHAARRRMGELLAQQEPADADLVMGVPDSGIPAAEGFALASGIPYGQGLVKNRYIGRTFITPTQEARDKGVRRKLNPLRENIDGQRLVVVDDSIVRGTTTRQMVKMLREAGATEVHLRISSPPFRWPCFYGIDTPDRDELLAARMDEAEIAVHLGADSIGYLSLENLVAAIGADGAGFCDACLTGVYPTEIPLSLTSVAR
jgi:amidophosphoribosyltransferase